MEMKACCAHLTVKFMPHLNNDGSFTERWECQDCRQPFTPYTRAPQWQHISTAPRDGRSFYGRVIMPMRYLPYKKGHNEDTDGRWQTVNEYGGWENTDHVPEDWEYQENYIHAPPEVG